MAGSANQFAYQLGATQIPVGLSTTIQVIPPRGCNGLYLGWQSGGTLAVVQGPGGSFITTNGFVLTTSERLQIEGPATFFLAAAGSTSIAGIVWLYSAGYSLTP